MDKNNKKIMVTHGKGCYWGILSQEKDLRDSLDLSESASLADAAEIIGKGTESK